MTRYYIFKTDETATQRLVATVHADSESGAVLAARRMMKIKMIPGSGQLEARNADDEDEVDSALAEQTTIEIWITED